MTEQVKVLVCGDVRGQFDALFKRVSQVNAKVGPFEMLLCVGEFFDPDESAANVSILSGELAVPLPTYILGASCPETLQHYPNDTSSSGVELAPNVTYLGRYGQLSSASGLQIAYVSGVETWSDDALPYQFDQEACERVCAPTAASTSYIGVDLLLTCVWPAQVDKFAQAKPREKVSGSESISKVAGCLKPRYHFAGLSDVHYERQPYRNHRVLQETSVHTSRFIGLAQVNNKRKEKFLYAFNIVPMKKLNRQALVEQPPNASEFPYAEAIRDATVREQQKAEQRQKQRQFFYNTEQQAEDQWDRKNNRKRGRQQIDGGGDGGGKKMVPSGPCWFCLSSPDVEKQLVVSVGDCCYLAMAKGALVDSHVLVLPVGHIQSLVGAPSEVRQEVARFKSALSQCFASFGQCCVFFERNYRTQHLQIQAVPLPIDQLALIQKAFTQQAQLKGIELVTLAEGEEIWDVLNEGCPYFFVELPDGTKLFTRQMRQFPIQFGREVLAGAELLNMPERADWRSCTLSKKEESDSAIEFRKKFSKYDFTDDGDDDE